MNKVYEIVTQKILEKIQEAAASGKVLPWQKPWTPANTPTNYVSGRPYRGVNLMLLDGGEYLTWSQLCDLQKHDPALRLRKGSKSHMVVYFSFKESTKDVVTASGAIEQKEVRIPFLRYYKVFSSADVEGLKPHPKQAKREHQPIEEAERVMERYITREGLRVRYLRGDKACYSPVSDEVTLPPREYFEDINEFYSTAFHELGHSTGAASRLGRLKPFVCWGDENYGKEELVAELTSAMVCGHCGIDASSTIHNSAAYVHNWMDAIRGDVTMVVSASSKAQRAADFILGVSEQAEMLQ